MDVRPITVSPFLNPAAAISTLPIIWVSTELEANHDNSSIKWIRLVLQNAIESIATRTSSGFLLLKVGRFQVY